MKGKPLILIFSLLLSISVVSRSSQSTQQTSLPKHTTIPFEMANRHIMLKVKVNNSRPLSFVLDTGDKYAIVDLGVDSGPGESIPIQVNQAEHPILEAEVTPVGSPATKGKFILDIGSGGALALHERLRRPVGAQVARSKVGSAV